MNSNTVSDTGNQRRIKFSRSFWLIVISLICTTIITIISVRNAEKQLGYNKEGNFIKILKQNIKEFL